MILTLITWWPFEMTFFPFIKVHLSMWSPTALIGSIDSSTSVRESTGYFWRILAPEQYYMRAPFATRRGFYSQAAWLKTPYLVVV